MANGPTQIERVNGDIASINEGKGEMQSLFHIEIDRVNDKERMIALKQELLTVLKDTRLVVEDWHSMTKQINTVIQDIESNRGNIPIEAERMEEGLAFYVG